MPGADTQVDGTDSLFRTLAKHYFTGISWAFASVAVLTRELGLPSIALSDSLTLHVDHVVIIGAVFVAIVFPLIVTLLEVASEG